VVIFAKKGEIKKKFGRQANYTLPPAGRPARYHGVAGV
jgi:hypothetical protein